MSKDPGYFTQDTAFKNLLVDFPEDAIRWMVPDAEARFGPIQKVEFLREESHRHWLSESGRELDIPMKVTFANERALITLVEHKGDKASFSIYHLCRYVLDLAEREPELEIVPVVIFADPHQWDKDEDVQRSIDLGTMGQHFLHFHYLRIKLRELVAEDQFKSNNPLSHILAPLMTYPKGTRLLLVMLNYFWLLHHVSIRLLHKYMDFIDRYAKIKPAEREQIIQILDNHEEGAMIADYLIERRTKELEREGERKGKREVAFKMMDQGLSMEVIVKCTDFTGQELEQFRQERDQGQA